MSWGMFELSLNTTGFRRIVSKKSILLLKEIITVVKEDEMFK